MPDPVEKVPLVDASGNAVDVPVDQAGKLLLNGWHLQTGKDVAARTVGAAKEDLYGGVGGGVAAAAGGLLRGATLGASDVANRLIGGEDAARDAQALREQNPGISTGAQIIGGLAPAFVAPESLLAKTPAGLAARAGSEIAGLGEGAGFLTRTAFSTAGAATEGALQNAGGYISDVALGDKELSAEGLGAALGNGALWAGVAGGALSVAGDGLVAARRLFPREEVTREAVDLADSAARTEVKSALDESKDLETAARDEARRIRAQHAAQNLETKKALDDIAIKKAQELADAQVAKAKSQAEAAAARAERAKAPRGRGRKPVAEEPAGEVPAVGESPVAATAEPATVAEGATASPADDLMSQLQGTKSALDEGATLAELSNAPREPSVIGLKPTHIEDALNEHIATLDPRARAIVDGMKDLGDARDAMSSWLEKYGGGGGNVGRFERSEASRSYAEGMRPKEAGYYNRTPEGNIALPRGRQAYFRGTEEERAAMDAATIAKVSPEERALSDAAVARQFGGKSLAQRIIDEGEPTVDEAVGKAINSPTKNIDEDVGQAADAISRFEAAHAQVTEALGPTAPPSASVRAQAFREAQAKAEDATSRAIADHAKDIDQEMLKREVGTTGKAPTGKPVAGKSSGMLGKAGDMVGMLEMLGHNMPLLHNIPVVGPVLSAFLKARVMSKAFGRFGGKVAETAETTIASKAAQSKQRMYEAVDAMLEPAGKAVRGKAPAIGGGTAVLASKLFDDGKPTSTPYTSTPTPKGSLPQLYLARAAEVQKAMEPDAVKDAVRARIHTSDPDVLDAIIQQQITKFTFLDSKLPKPSEPPLPTAGPEVIRPPATADMMKWSRYVAAAEDPIGVLEAAAKGELVSPEAVETLKTVYPKLYAQAQQRVLEKSMDLKKPLPYARRVQLSAIFGIPMDNSQTPEGAAFLQNTFKANPTPLGAGGGAPAQPGAPTIRADVSLAQRTDPSSKERL